MREAFHSARETDEQTEVGDLRDVADHFVANVVTAREVVPFVRQELADRERQALILTVDIDDSGLDRIALLQHLRRMLEAPMPGHVRDVNEPVNAFLDFDERAEVSEVA